MDDFEQQLRRHYEGQDLPPARVQAILAAGRVAAKARARRMWSWLAAAIVILGLGLFSTSHQLRERSNPTSVTTAAVADAVKKYFSNPEYSLPVVSADRATLVEWLRRQGGPADFIPPPALAGLPSYGCQVLTVQGRQVFLICFLLDSPRADTPAGAMPAKKMMLSTGPDGQMMKKAVPLIHLVVMPLDGFSKGAAAGDRVVLSAGDDWHYTAWTRGNQLYLAAGAVPADRLAGLVKAL